jgi:HEAT repeat protein
VSAPGANALGRVTAAARSCDWPELIDVVEHNPDPRLRSLAIAELVRGAPRPVAAGAWPGAAADADARVRLRAAQVAPALRTRVTCSALLVLLSDEDAWVAEAAAFALGEHPRCSGRALHALEQVATTHDDPLLREAAVAALGAQGVEATLPTILAACDDKPAIRRRAVLALANFDGDEVEARLQAALTDRDWQVRQAAEDLLHHSELA